MSKFNRERKDYHAVGKSIPKKDSSQLLLGKPVFTNDIIPSDCLVIKLLRSPHAHALVEDINTDYNRTYLFPFSYDFSIKTNPVHILHPTEFFLSA
jgi:hypothetical protein